MADETPRDDRVLSVPAARLLQDWKGAHERGVAYLAALGIAAEEREALAAAAVERALRDEPWDDRSDATAQTLAALRRLLPERYPRLQLGSDAVTDEFVGWRVDAHLSARFAADGTAAAAPRLPRIERGRLWPGPELARRTMVPDKIERSFLRPFLSRMGPQFLMQRRSPPEDRSEGAAVRSERRRQWTRVASHRRLLLGFLVLIPSIVASGFMLDVLPHKGETPIELAIVLFFGALFGWISIGFWTATLGFFTLIFGDRFAITKLDGEEEGPLDPVSRTALVMPICEEPVDRVFAGLKAIHRSLERAGALHHFDFFILSDTSDPANWVAEEAAWAEWCRAVDGFGRIFYRRRRVRLKRKSGNVADFCRRWGRRYRYMIMLDADSVMSGDTLVRLVKMMERYPEAGMIQTAPVSVNRRSLFARAQQFASRVYGPMFSAGLHFWQLGDGQYWGHNAIIRIKPFADHCGLAPLPGKPPLGGEILSHDFVEAALMGRCGWTLWLAFDLGGSYEETPPSLLEEMKRDRRWCQGNLQHLRLIFTEGLFGAHRALFLNGVLSYVSAAIWFCFLSLSTAEAILNALREPNYFPSGHGLFPEWPIWRPDWALSLMAVTGIILFLPKVLSVLLIAIKGRNTRSYGGIARLSLSVLLEILLSSLFAPIRMLFHTKFVLQNLAGRTVSWRSQGREDAETGWKEAIYHHGLDTIFATAWGTGLYLLNPDYFWWVTPIIGALILSIPLSVYASRVSLGQWARAAGLFLIPEEVCPPPELRDMDENLERARRAAAQLPQPQRDGFVRCAIDPYVNALRRALLGRPGSLRPSIRAARRALLDRAVAGGPSALAAGERKVLLYDSGLVGELHDRLWQSLNPEDARRWGRPPARPL